jgi:hypothetical protein
VYRATDLALQLNSYYLHLCGSLDNLAWAVQYEWDVLPGVSETSPGRQKVALYHPVFIKALRASRPAVATALVSHAQWYTELRDLRDPAAHRVPIYAVPGVLTETDAAEYQRLQAIVDEKARAGDHDGMMEVVHEASNLGGYAPYMSVWTPNGETLVDAWAAVVRDHRKFQTVSAIVSEALLPARAG